MNRKGQMTVEMVLIVTLLLTAAIGVSKLFRENETLSKFVHGPWAQMSGMIKYGVWVKDQDGIAVHPNVGDRVRTPLGEEPK